MTICVVHGMVASGNTMQCCVRGGEQEGVSESGGVPECFIAHSGHVPVFLADSAPLPHSGGEHSSCTALTQLTHNLHSLYTADTRPIHGLYTYHSSHTAHAQPVHT